MKITPIRNRTQAEKIGNGDKERRKRVMMKKKKKKTETKL